MRSILLDESVPRGLAKMLAGPNVHVTHVPEIGLAGAKDGDVLRAAAAFDVFVTCDQNLAKQQKIEALSFAIVVICTNNWRTILANCTIIAALCQQVQPGAFAEVLKAVHVTRYGRRPKHLNPS